MTEGQGAMLVGALVYLCIVATRVQAALVNLQIELLRNRVAATGRQP